MELDRYLRVVRRWGWMLVVCPVIAAVTAGMVALALPPVYQGQVSIYVKPAQPLTSLDPSVAVTSDQITRTYARLITERPIVEKLIKDFGLSTSVEDLTKKISVTPEPNTTILDVTVENTDRTLARDLANALVDDFIAENNRRQQLQLDNSTSRLQTQINSVADAISQDEIRIRQLKAVSSPTAAQQQELTTVEDQLARDRTRYDGLIQNLSSVQAAAARNTENLVVVAPAALPDKPKSPNKLLDVVLAGAAGLLAAIGLAMLFEQLDQTVRTDDDLIARTGLLPIGHIGFITSSKARRGELVALLEASPVIEAYKTLRTNLLFSGIDHVLKTIVISSAGPGEGKSRTAANLAVVLAEAGHKTLLIDADFRRPTQHRIFGKVRNVGLSNLILQDLPEADLISTVERPPDLWLICAGPTPPNPSELLGSNRMKELIARLKANFSFIVVDTPPINAVADALILAAAADGTILVVEHGRTTFPALNHAKRSLDRVSAHTLGAVINKMRATDAATYYYTYGSENAPAEQTSSPQRSGMARE